MGQIKLMFSIGHFTFHRKIFQISELKVRRREKSVHILSVYVTLMWVIIPHPGLGLPNFVYLSSGFEFLLHFGFKVNL